MKKNKRGFKNFTYKFLKADGISLIIAIIAVAILCVVCAITNKDIEIFEWKIFSSVVIAMILGIVSKMIASWIMNWVEDSVKLTDNYDELLKKYPNTKNFVVYDNTLAMKDRKNAKALKKVFKDNNYKVTFPVSCEEKLDGLKIKIKDVNIEYELPEYITEHFDELILAHSTSRVYNQLNIRVDNWKKVDDKFVINTSRTTYYDSLVTNRAMDFRLKNGLSVREKFEYGPFLYPLKDSLLSNHLGMNGFIESADGEIVFVKRNKKLSIGKGTYGNSIGASVKTKYCLDCNNEKFKEEGLENAIIKEISDELKIEKENLKDFSLNSAVIAAYRDYIEGGKPQLLFYVKTTLDKKKIMEDFAVKNQKSSKKSMLVDGEKFLWIKRKEINNVVILPDRIVYKGKSYWMVPSSSASVAMFVEYLNKN